MFCFCAQGGIALLESVDALMNGVALMFVVIMELTCLMYVYRSRDFQSDMHLATEDSTCSSSSRIGIQWHYMPFLTLVCKFILISRFTDRTLLCSLNSALAYFNCIQIRFMSCEYIRK